MMGTTHALMGMLFGLTAAFYAPEYLFYAGLAGFLGGLLPDTDLLYGHRRLMHFPVGYTVLSAAAVLPALLAPAALTVSLLYFFVSAAAHSVIDVFGGGLEERPWEATSDDAVYSHTLGKWLRARRYVRYDGAPEDLGLTMALAVPCYHFYAGNLELLVVAAVVTGFFYMLVRKKMMDWIPDKYL